MLSCQRRGGSSVAALALVAVLAGCLESGTSGTGGSPEADDRADGTTTFINPVLDTDFADPHVVRDGDTFYAYATGQAGSSTIAVATSDDLVEWSEPKDALPERPDWQPLQ